MTAPTLVLGSGNPGKAAELARLVRPALAGCAVAVVDLGALPGFVPPVEDGDTYERNALIKARAVAAAAPGAAVLADDSGIEVDALGGEPGIRSARWATDGGGAPLDGAGLNAALLARLGSAPPALRRARLVSAVALIVPGRPPALARGEVPGSIALEQRGSAGFGYDALFVLPDGRRFSEVAAQAKDAVSHRGAAVRGIRAPLRRWSEGCRTV